MSSEVCASGMLSFVRQMLREANDYGSLTIRELRRKYTKSMGIVSLSPDEKETFRAIVDQAIMEHEVEKDEEKKKSAEQEQFSSPVKSEQPKVNTTESPLILKTKNRRMSYSDTDDDKIQGAENSSGDASILDAAEQERNAEQANDKLIAEVFRDNEGKENSESDDPEFFVKKKKKKRKLKRYSLDKDSNVSNSDSNEKRLTIPRIKLVRDYSVKPKSDNNSDFDEFINNVVKAATGSANPELKQSEANKSEDVSQNQCTEQLSMTDRTVSDKTNTSEVCNDSAKVRPSESEDSDSDDQPLARYRSNVGGSKGGASNLTLAADENHMSNPSKKMKRDTSIDSYDGENEKNDANGNSTDFSDDDSTLDSSRLRKRKRRDKEEAVGNGTKKNAEDHHIQRYRRYLKEAGLRVSYKKMFEGCNSFKSKIQKMKAALEEAGVEGRPTLEKCRKVKKKREREQELASLDKSNIIGMEGRPKRNTRSTYVPPPDEESLSQSQPSETLQEVRKTFSRLKGIIDSEDSE